MTAGRGITHSERFERARSEGGHMNGIQAWVALPKEEEETDPAFAHHGTNDLPLLDENGVRMRLIAGEAFGARANVKIHSPLFYLHCEMPAGERAQMPNGYSERALYIASGSVDVGGERHTQGQMLVFSDGQRVPFTALEPAVVMLLGGEPVGERYIEWNFVSSSRERIEQAKADWRAGRMKLPYFDNAEFIPLPGDPPPPPNPMS
jgi:redox-sensitive bicupin YhaK (pirin superfamily)